jgi:redox-sensitive bicupin YhaK (pirin superfamily)
MNIGVCLGKDGIQMIETTSFDIRRSGDRGYAEHGWLKSYHSFSFADYQDDQHVQFGPLRVINEDWIEGGMGFGTHPHRDMEIITYLLDGKLAHKDSTGSGSTIEPGDVQRMSAGRGVLHSEFNPEPREEAHLLQIWIMPNVRGIEPSYEEKHFSKEEKRGRLRLIAAPDSAEGSVLIHQDARVYAGLFDGVESARFPVAAGRRAYLHVARGSIKVNGTALVAGDALKVSEPGDLVLADGADSEVLLFDLP